jgi:NAD+ synthase (glutamine-hydrolysing)
MRIVMAQINTVVGDVEGNRNLVLEYMDRSRGLGADLVLFPELSLTGYPPRDLLGIHGFVDSNLRALQEIARRSEGIAAIVGFADRNPRQEGKELCNAAALVHEGRIQAVYHKRLLPTYDVFDEDRYFEEGRQTGLIPFKGGTLGISICEDAWNAQDFRPKPLYPVDPISDQAAGGADLLINISASPFEMGKPGLRYGMLRDHVRKNRRPLLYLNLVGGNDDILFDGNSLALDCDGSVIAKGKPFEEDLIVVDSGSRGECGFAGQEAMESLFDALVMGTRDYAKKCGFRSAVLGLSGGIDSAVTACIAARALGSRQVLGVSMPSVYSAPESHDDALTLARNLGIDFRVIPIQPVFAEYRETLRDVFAGTAEDATEENLQARVRGNILMALSNKFGHLVLSTGNKSELAAGYCTLYGDMAGGLAVISDVPKTLVYRLAAHINRERRVIPENTLKRAPTAELRPDQTDQDTLPPYDVLDGILRLRIEEQLSVEEIVSQGYDPGTVRSIVRLVHRNEYKRRQAAPGLKVTTRAFGTGRRMPIAMRLHL